MTKRARRSSLGKTLSLWIALQVLIGLTLVSIVVYMVIATHLNTRKAHTLTEKRDLVNHLLDEARVNGDIEELIHRLDDFLDGHHDIGLHIIDLNGATLFSSNVALTNASDSRTIRFPTTNFFDGASMAEVILSHNNDIDNALLSRLALTLVGAVILGSLLVSYGVFALVRRGLRPVNDLAKQTVQLSASTLESRLDGSGQPTELQPLVTQFNQLLERLSDSYMQLEAFNADVAHELNTPLTTLLTSTELALRRPQDLKSLNEVLGSNLEELHRMSEIIKDMLFLSHAERGGLARRTSVESLAEIANEVAEYHEAPLSEASLAVKIVGDAAGEFDVPLIKRALSNLLGNAARFADSGSTLQVDIEAEKDHRVCISVVNQGVTISAESRDKLFDRFYRADISRSEAGLHHGLGLSIVAGIARMHGGEPFVESMDATTKVGFSVSP